MYSDFTCSVQWVFSETGHGVRPLPMYHRLKTVPLFQHKTLNTAIIILVVSTSFHYYTTIVHPYMDV